MARSGTSVYRVSIRGAGQVAAQFSRAQRQLQDEVNAVLREAAAEAEVAFKAHAPEDTEDLRNAIHSVLFFRAARPRVTVQVGRLSGHEGARRDGYDYLDVTRRGHRRSRIQPKAKKALKVHIEGHRNPHAAIVRASVRGYGHAAGADLAAATSRARREQVRAAARPVDWVVEAGAEVDALLGNLEDRLGRRIDSRVF